MKNNILVALGIIVLYFLVWPYIKPNSADKAQFQQTTIVRIPLKVSNSLLDSLYMLSHASPGHERIIYLSINPIEKEQPTITIVDEKQ